MEIRIFLLAPCLAAVLAGCGHSDLPKLPPARLAPILNGDPAHPGQATGWVETHLYFGLGPADVSKAGVSEATWREFLDREVTPRFPDGLSVADIYGQWQGKGQPSPERLRSKVLIIDYPDNQGNRDKVEAIRAAWKKLTGDQSVLCVTQPAEVSF